MSTLTAPSLSTGVSHAALVARMKQIVGNDNVLTSAADMAAYECDGFTIEKNKPDVVVFPTTTEQIVGIVKACNELGVAVPRPRGGHEPRRRLPAGRRRRHDRAGADEADPRGQRPRPLRRRRAGRRQSLAHQPPQAARLPLRPGPVEPGGLHHRRQRRDQLRRAAHAQVRRHRQPRPRRRARAARWPRRARAAGRARTTPATT